MTRPQVLPDDLTAAHAAGVKTVVSLLQPAEAAKIGLGDEAQAATALGLAFLNHPIRDMHLPDPASFADFAGNLATRIQNGDHIAVHCYASIGRSGMLTCAILGHFGFDAQTALSHVSAIRGTAVPDTPAQTAFIHQIMRARGD